MEKKQQEEKASHQAKQGVKKEETFEERLRRRFPAFGRLAPGELKTPEAETEDQKSPSPASLNSLVDFPKLHIGPIPKPTMSIAGIFYARFLPQEGTKIIHQIPRGCIVPEETAKNSTLFPFEAISEFIIPRQAFCNRYITVNSPCNKYIILGFPVCIKDEKYVRNEFIFNFGLVIPSDSNALPYEAVVRRLASTFQEMELQDQFLSEEAGPNTKGRRPISALIEIILHDLNSYGECKIPVDTANEINMKLFPSRENPPPVKAWHVPILNGKLDDLIDDTWDITMKRIIPFIDGVCDVQSISVRADVALDLTKIALRHLLYYKAIELLDMFFFSNIYACTPTISEFVQSYDMQRECINYVKMPDGDEVTPFMVCRYYTSFVQGRDVKQWLFQCHEGEKTFRTIDIRRLVQFGVTKGFLYRVHKHVVSAQKMAGVEVEKKDQDKEKEKGKGKEKERNKDGDDDDDSDEEIDLEQYADGLHCFDQMNVETGLRDTELISKMREHGGTYDILYR